MLKKILKTLLLIVICIFVIIQFFRPKKDTTIHAPEMAIEGVVQVPSYVSQTLKKSCYDCHSDQTTYPWYWNVQPVGWFLANHIKDGKRHLNFSDFGSYNLRRKYKKLGEIKEEVEHGEMPMKSYTILHRDAGLTESQKAELYAWVDASLKYMEANYPMDSLIRK